ncbi:hypothetical protein Salat_2079200 [Sesamum alatum]|uniref:Uncharacterized protein n=1 Tax=Sesamum alatum TaxID=300844 RepID=A0AAE1Y111_9LAMI|nr:hypothetical protein Salat_2079200 [Sesamum alatum]
MVRKLLDDGIKERAASLQRKEAIINAVREDSLYGDVPNNPDDSSDEDDDDMDEHGMSALERKQLNGPYMQSMIDTIVEVGPGVKGPSGYQIDNIYLNEEIEELEKYISTLKVK